MGIAHEIKARFERSEVRVRDHVGIAAKKHAARECALYTEAFNIRQGSALDRKSLFICECWRVVEERLGSH